MLKPRWPLHAARRFEGSLEQLASIREFINEVARQYGCGEYDIFALELACDEAAANVFNHAFEGKRGRLDFEIWRDEESVTVRFRYGGKAFDPEDVPEPELDVPIEARRVGGLGLYFMRQLMNEVVFEFSDAAGNVLTMRRVLTNESEEH